MPPEMVSDAGYGKGNDCWAAGVVCFSLLQGGMPFFSDAKNRDVKRKEMFAKIKSEEPTWTVRAAAHSPSTSSTWSGVSESSPVAWEILTMPERFCDRGRRVCGTRREV